GPAVVVALASVPYLPTTLQVPAMERAVREAAAEIGRRCGVETGVSARFPAICDMSSFGQAQADELALIEDETPCWADGIGGVGSLGLPCVNAGPWGRAYHTRLERMERDYGFRVLPELVRELAAAMLRTTMLQKAESGA
ncbi:MAG: arginine utilization protein RocB, partial [Gluconacetobacter diazotrophicus]|nr:arginine utilization protein RocB [Gluconacetobacter diazotrophicus]